MASVSLGASEVHPQDKRNALEITDRHQAGFQKESLPKSDARAGHQCDVCG
jgi:hypothetical protein